MSKNKKKTKKKNAAEIFLVISALFLGILIVILVSGTKKKIKIEGTEEERIITGDYPLPSELIITDKMTYFPYMEIPDVVFNKMNKVSFTEDCPVSREDLRYVKVLYWGTDSRAHTGELIVNKLIAEKVRDIFYELYKASYVIERIEPVDVYGANDEVSMSYNNTSCFNARKITGSNEWSEHAYGMAVDINPLYNPYVSADGKVLPLSAEKYADRNNVFKMKIDSKDYAYTVFKKYGFSWGGEWEPLKDYQHFEYREDVS